MSDTPYPAPEVNLPRDGGEMLNLADLRPKALGCPFDRPAQLLGCPGADSLFRVYINF